MKSMNRRGGSSAMFYSHDLLGRKSPLGAVWTMAHGKKLSKLKILGINVADICHLILQPDVPHSLRLTGILIGGVVIVFNKQQIYLMGTQDDKTAALTLDAELFEAPDLQEGDAYFYDDAAARPGAGGAKPRAASATATGTATGTAAGGAAAPLAEVDGMMDFFEMPADFEMPAEFEVPADATQDEQHQHQQQEQAPLARKRRRGAADAADATSEDETEGPAAEEGRRVPLRSASVPLASVGEPPEHMMPPSPVYADDEELLAMAYDPDAALAAAQAAPAATDPASGLGRRAKRQRTSDEDNDSASGAMEASGARGQPADGEEAHEQEPAAAAKAKGRAKGAKQQAGTAKPGRRRAGARVTVDDLEDTLVRAGHYREWTLDSRELVGLRRGADRQRSRGQAAGPLGGAAAAPVGAGMVAAVVAALARGDQEAAAAAVLRGSAAVVGGLGMGWAPELARMLAVAAAAAAEEGEAEGDAAAADEGGRAKRQRTAKTAAAAKKAQPGGGGGDAQPSKPASSDRSDRSGSAAEDGAGIGSHGAQPRPLRSDGGVEGRGAAREGLRADTEELVVEEEEEEEEAVEGGGSHGGSGGGGGGSGFAIDLEAFKRSAASALGTLASEWVQPPVGRFGASGGFWYGISVPMWKDPGKVHGVVQRDVPDCALLALVSVAGCLATSPMERTDQQEPLLVAGVAVVAVVQPQSAADQSLEREVITLCTLTSLQLQDYYDSLAMNAASAELAKGKGGLPEAMAKPLGSAEAAASCSSSSAGPSLALRGRKRSRAGEALSGPGGGGPLGLLRFGTGALEDLLPAIEEAEGADVDALLGMEELGEGDALLPASENRTGGEDTSANLTRRSARPHAGTAATGTGTGSGTAAGTAATEGGGGGGFLQETFGTATQAPPAKGCEGRTTQTVIAICASSGSQPMPRLPVGQCQH
ncbi:Sister chromatid cohesion 1 protein 3 [Tetrabaena socialis]|uniref:Sister chromatid cohesion 1 protein 3 n=1 Tax=Tetrabaena socialis TaxID=47790 RepID=A0A2J8A4F8_9CHLO|nr:Sister chromatid cohesion 1 protein 3 [Tetrabaena socialis]|eukprot:PNH07399.1 Sister chromatid cohesion 1 protein 3 [Tetrabaena socialis]